MPQVILPVYPEGTKFINSFIGIKTVADRDTVVYFNPGGPIYQHAQDDLNSFRYITSQMMDMGLVKQKEVIRAFEISPESAKRWLKVYRTKGATGFFGAKNTRKKGNVMTPAVIQKAEALFRSGKTVKEVSNELGIKQDTLQKSIRSGKVVLPVPGTGATAAQSSTASVRNADDSQSAMGMGCTNPAARVEAIKKK